MIDGTVLFQLGVSLGGNVLSGILIDFTGFFEKGILRDGEGISKNSIDKNGETYPLRLKPDVHETSSYVPVAKVQIIPGRSPELYGFTGNM